MGGACGFLGVCSPCFRSPPYVSYSPGIPRLRAGPFCVGWPTGASTDTLLTACGGVRPFGHRGGWFLSSCSLPFEWPEIGVVGRCEEIGLGHRGRAGACLLAERSEIGAAGSCGLVGLLFLLTSHSLAHSLNGSFIHSLTRSVLHSPFIGLLSLRFPPIHSLTCSHWFVRSLFH